MEAPSQSTVLMEFQTNEYNINEIDSKYINDSLPHDSFLLIDSFTVDFWSFYTCYRWAAREVRRTHQGNLQKNG